MKLVATLMTVSAPLIAVGNSISYLAVLSGSQTPNQSGSNTASGATKPGSHRIKVVDSTVVDTPFGEPGRLETIGFKQYFINSCPFFRNSNERKYGRALPFGVSNSKVRELIDQICAEIYSGKMPYVKGEKVEIVSQKLLNLVDETLYKNGMSICPKFLRQWLSAEAICAWIVGEFDGDEKLAEEKSYDKWWSAIQPEITLNQHQPKTICSGASMLARALADNLSSEVGFKCYYISGWFRMNDGSVPDNSNHAWVCFEFDKQIFIPADTVPAGYSKDARVKWNHKELPTSFLPLNREAWEVFLSLRWGSFTTLSGNKNAFFEPMSNPNLRISLETWKSTKLAPNFPELSAWAIDHPYK